MAKSRKIRNKMPAALRREKRRIAVERTDSDSFAVVLQKHLDESTLPQKKSKGVSLEEFAIALNKDLRTAINYLSGTTVPSPKDFKRIEKFLSNVKPSFAETRQRLLDAFRRSKRASNTLADAIAANVLEAEAAKVRPPDATEHRPRPRNLPYPSLGRLFTGRADVLKQIHARLFSPEDNSRSVVACAICGLGGVGKTRVAIEYAFRYREEYSALFFLRADSASNLRSEFAALASPQNINLPEAEATNDEIKISAVLRWLDMHPTWLMIFDNVDDPEAVHTVQSWLAKLSAGHLLLNGRMSNLPASIPKLDELGALDHAAALEFLLMRTHEDRARGDDDDEQASELVTELGCLALGLEQAGAYIATERISISRYLELWRKKRKIVMEWFDRGLMAYDHDTGLAATWATSFDRLSTHSRRLLERLSYFAPSPIPDSIFEIFNDDEAASLTMHSAKTGLFSYSLISKTRMQGKNAACDGFIVHGLVQDFMRRRMSKVASDEAISDSAVWIVTAYSGNVGDTLTWPTLEPLVPHMLALARFGDERRLVFSGVLYQRVGGFFSVKGRFLEAEPALRRSTEIIRVANEANPLSIASSIGNLAALLYKMYRLDEAENLYKEALVLLNCVSVEAAPKAFVTVLNTYSELLSYSSRDQEAAELAQRSYGIAKKYLAKNDPEFVKTIIGLSALLRLTNKLELAEKFSRLAVELTAPNAALKQHYAESLIELAMVLRKKGQLHFDEAEACYISANKIAVECYSDNHPYVALILHEYVLLLRESNRQLEAEPLMRASLGILAVHYPANHPDFTRAIDTLQSLLRTLGLDAEPDVLQSGVNNDQLKDQEGRH
jgi:tetratricopeptide (TPR) repeat protein/transcriptional regulator with XRE-family HTH domain